MEDFNDDDPTRKMWEFKSPIAIFASKRVYNVYRLTPVAIQMDANTGKKRTQNRRRDGSQESCNFFYP